MKFLLASTAIGLALAAGATAAQAQTIISPQPMVTVPAATVVSQPLETVQTTETVRTIRPAPAADSTPANRDDAHHHAPDCADHDSGGADWAGVQSRSMMRPAAAL